MNSVRRAQVRILATTDLHMNLTSHDYYADRPDPTVGLTRTATLIRQARQEAAKTGALVLLFDNGDGMQGTPLNDCVTARPDRPHPLMRAFGHLDYDAIGLGNHDFNFGLKPLDYALRQAPCPVLCSNLKRLNTGAPAGFEPFSILDRMVRCGDRDWPIRFGILSFVPPQTVTWDRDVLAGEVEAEAIVANARKWLPELKAAGCDVVIALAHSGLGGPEDHPDLENAVLPLAELDGIDVVVSGHTHLRFPGPDHAGMTHVDATRGAVHGKPTIMAGTSGSHLGQIDLDLIAAEGQGWMAAGFSCAIHPIAQRDADGVATAVVEEDPDLVEVLAEDHRQTRALMDQTVGHSAVPLHSYFTFFAFDRGLALVAAAQLAALRPHLPGADTEGLPLLSASAPGKFGARAGPMHYTDVPAGALNLRNIADLHPFANQLQAVIVTGRQLREWIEMTTALFHRIDPGRPDQPLVDARMPGHDFDVLHGLRYEIDLSRPCRYAPDGQMIRPETHRVTELTCNGRPIAPDDRFVVVLNSYRGNGGGPFRMLADAQQVPLPAITLRDAILRYVAAQPDADPIRDKPSWRFAPIANAAATALTGPGAETHLGELATRGVETLGRTADGFLRLKLPF